MTAKFATVAKPATVTEFATKREVAGVDANRELRQNY
jgi:hypothetical protein